MILSETQNRNLRQHCVLSGGSYGSCTFTQRKCLIKSESVCLSVWCAWEKKIRSVWVFCIVFAFTARPPPLDLRGLSTISECPFHVPLTRTMTEPRWELWQTHIYTPKWPQTDPLQLCSSSQPLLYVFYIFNKDTVFVLTLLFLKSPDLCFLPLWPSLHKCLLIYMFVMFMNSTLILCYLLIVRYCFEFV